MVIEPLHADTKVMGVIAFPDVELRRTSNRMPDNNNRDERVGDFAEELQNEPAFSAVFANSAHGCVIYK